MLSDETTQRPEFITPYLPDEALIEIRTWSVGGKPAFHRVVEQPRSFLMPSPPPICKNCAGSGRLFVSFCEAKAHDVNPSTHQPSTWFDGNDRWPKGWYKIKSTKYYDCPSCQGTGKAQPQQERIFNAS